MFKKKIQKKRAIDPTVDWIFVESNASIIEKMITVLGNLLGNQTILIPSIIFC